MADENIEGNELDGLEGAEGAQGGGQQGGGEQKPPAKEEKDVDLKAAMADLATTVKGLAEKGGEKKEEELTQEQINEAWGIYDPEKNQKDFFKKWFRLNPDATPEEVKEVKDLFADMQKGLVRQAVIGARNVLAGEFQKIREETKPLMDYFTERKSKETREAFNEAYPALADEKYTKVVNATAKSLKQEDFKTNEEYFKALAESAAETIKQILPEFDLGKVEEKKKTAATTPRLPRTSVGGTGGTGGGSNKAPDSGSTRNDLDDLS